MSFTTTARQTMASAVALAIIAGLPTVVFSHPLASPVASRQGVGSLGPSQARGPLALPPQVIARLRPGRSIYSSDARNGFVPNSLYTNAAVVFGSDHGANQVNVFKQSNLANVAVLSDATAHACNSTPLNGPQGIWVDHARNLWVADSGNGDVREFHVSHRTSAVTLGDLPGYTPISPAVDSAVTGNVYATNASSGPWNIVGWSPSGSTFNCGQLPNIVLSDPTFQWVYFLATDGAGDVYVNYITWDFVPRVCFIKAPIPASNAAICTGTAGNYVSNVAPGMPGGMQVLPASAGNRLTLVDQYAAGVGYYDTPLPIVNGGAPVFVINPPATGGFGPFVDPVMSAVYTANGSRLWASDATTVPGGALLQMRRTAAFLAGHFTAEITGFAQLFGAAVSPSHAL